MSSRSKSDLNLGKAGRSRRDNADSNMRASRQRSSSPPTQAEATRYRSRSPPGKHHSRVESATVNVLPDKSKPAPRNESEDTSLDATSSPITQSSVSSSSGALQEKAARAKFTQSISSASSAATSVTPSMDPRQHSGGSQRCQNNGSFRSNAPNNMPLPPLSSSSSEIPRSDPLHPLQQQQIPVVDPQRSTSKTLESTLIQQNVKKQAVYMHNFPSRISICDLERGRPSHYLHVGFKSQDEAQYAIDQLDGKFFRGRRIFPSLSKAPIPEPKVEYPQENLVQYENVVVIAYAGSHPTMTDQVAKEFAARGTMIDKRSYAHYNPKYIVDKYRPLGWKAEFEFGTILQAVRAKNRFEGCIVQGEPLIIRYKYVDSTEARRKKAQEAEKEMKYLSESIELPKPVCFDGQIDRRFKWSNDHSQCCGQQKRQCALLIGNISKDTGVSIIKDELGKREILDYTTFLIISSHPKFHKGDKLVYLRFKTRDAAEKAKEVLQEAEIDSRRLISKFTSIRVTSLHQSAVVTNTLEAFMPSDHTAEVLDAMEVSGGKLIHQLDDNDYPWRWTSQGHSKEHVNWVKCLFEFESKTMAQRALNKFTPWVVGSSRSGDPLYVYLKSVEDASSEHIEKIKRALKAKEEQSKEESDRQERERGKKSRSVSRFICTHEIILPDERPRPGRDLVPSPLEMCGVFDHYSFYDLK
ncbi:hypothetical protein B0O99DRAFT_716879 [Bisporella sp. PMI_857]|nr:hypothetical protein B0O99DRAFT_716879 [Bisporella sp. PMI_857]